jgi:hypothetical protein
MLRVGTGRGRRFVGKIDSPDFFFQCHRLNARLNLARAELLGPDHPELNPVLAPLYHDGLTDWQRIA